MKDVSIKAMKVMKVKYFVGFRLPVAHADKDAIKKDRKNSSIRNPKNTEIMVPEMSSNADSVCSTDILLPVPMILYQSP